MAARNEASWLRLQKPKPCSWVTPLATIAPLRRFCGPTEEVMKKLKSILLALLLSVAFAGSHVPSAFAGEQEAVAPAVAEEPGFFDSVLGSINKVVETAFFFSVIGDAIQAPDLDDKGQPVIDEMTGKTKTHTIGLPFVVVVLVSGALFFTVWYRFINFRGFRHAINVVRGKYDDPEDIGEITHFQALTSALSATVGLGNIAGVAIAIQLGGPGAVFWMVLTAVFGMTSKFNSCTLAQIYRKKNPDGSIAGGPMYYLDIGLRELGGPVFPFLGKVLGVLFALMCIGGSLGGGNMFQSNQSFEALSNAFGVSEDFNHIFGVTMAGLVAAVIIGGIKRIGAATSKIVPGMVALYVGACLFVLVTHLSELPASLALIFERAFSQNAMYGGAAGVLVWGVQRAAFSNEAGVGSASIIHAAAKTDEPVREGMVAMLGPIIDTVIVCVMTAMVVIVTGAWEDPSIPQKAGITLTNAAFGRAISWFPAVLSICVLLFAYSTMISWSYYGERAWVYLLDHFSGLGQRTLVVYRGLFVLCVYVGAVTNLEQVLAFSDMMILVMALPNIIGGMILAPKVLPKVKDYWSRYTSGKMKPFS